MLFPHVGREIAYQLPIQFVKVQTQEHVHRAVVRPAGPALVNVQPLAAQLIDGRTEALALAGPLRNLEGDGGNIVGQRHLDLPCGALGRFSADLEPVVPDPAHVE